MRGRPPSLPNAIETVLVYLRQRLAEVRAERATAAAEMARLNKELEQLLVQEYVARWLESVEELNDL